MYRVLLESMNLGVLRMIWDKRPTAELPRRLGTRETERETEREPSLTAGYLIGPPSTIDPAAYA